AGVRRTGTRFVLRSRSPLSCRNSLNAGAQRKGRLSPPSDSRNYLLAYYGLCVKVWKTTRSRQAPQLVTFHKMWRGTRNGGLVGRPVVADDLATVGWRLLGFCRPRLEPSAAQACCASFEGRAWLRPAGGLSRGCFRV